MKTAGMILTFALCYSLLLADDKGNWKEYSSAEGQFKIHFPGVPEVGTVPNQKPVMHRVGLKRSSADGLGYTCYWTVKEKPFRNKEAETAYLKSFQEGAVKSSRGELDGEKEIELDGLTGREFFVKVSKNNYVRFRVYVSGKYVYNLQVWGTNNEAVQSQDADRFLKSFVVKSKSDKDTGK
jgi:hypothetical protein